jgi:hypothetical protein
MKIRGRGMVCVLAAATALAGPAWAQDDPASQAPAGTSGFGYRGWGPRVGLGADPDQILGGVHFVLGEFTQNVGFQPDIVLGLGDDVVSLVASAPVWYRFKPAASVRPYVGGALALGLFRVDTPDGDDTDFEIGLQVGGGGEWQLKSGNGFHAELRIDLGDVWDVAAFAGWTF